MKCTASEPLCGQFLSRPSQSLLPTRKSISSMAAPCRRYTATHAGRSNREGDQRSDAGRRSDQPIYDTPRTTLLVSTYIALSNQSIKQNAVRSFQTRGAFVSREAIGEPATCPPLAPRLGLRSASAPTACPGYSTRTPCTSRRCSSSCRCSQRPSSRRPRAPPHPSSVRPKSSSPARGRLELKRATPQTRTLGTR